MKHHPQCHPDCRLSLVETPEDAAIAYRLRYDAYRSIDAIPENPSGQFIDAYDSARNHYLFLLRDNTNHPIGSIRTLVYDPKSPRSEPLTAFEVFRPEIEQYIGLDKTIVEANRFVVDPKVEKSVDPTIIFHIFKACVLTTFAHNADFFIAAVRYEHLRIYRRVMTMEIGSKPKYYPGLACEMTLLILTMKRGITDVYPGLTKLHVTEDELRCFSSRLYNAREVN